MPIYDYRYKTWEGQRLGGWARWMAIPKFVYLDMFSKRMFIWLFAFSWLQFLLRLFYIYLLANEDFLTGILGIQELPPFFRPVNAEFFKRLIDGQMFFCFIFTFVLGSGLISSDLRHNAVVLFLSKPISRWEYFVGKFMSLFGLLFVLTAGQGLLLFGLQSAMAPADSYWVTSFWAEQTWLVWAILGYGGAVSVTLTLTILAASSLTSNSRYAGMAFAMYFIGSGIMGGVLYNLTASEASYSVSLLHVGRAVGVYLFSRGLLLPEYILTGWQTVLGLLVVWVLAGGLLVRRLATAVRDAR